MALRNAMFPTTPTSLASLLKSLRDVMRKEQRLNGDIGRLFILTCVMFLKLPDDLEIKHELEALLPSGLEREMGGHV